MFNVRLNNIQVLQIFNTKYIINSYNNFVIIYK